MKRLKDRKKKNLLARISISKKRALLVITPIFAAIIFGFYITGRASSVIPIRPFVNISEHNTELNCNYKNVKESIEVTTYSNINNYYKNLSQKSSALNNGDYSKFVHIDSADTVIGDVAE